jgi:NAD(P)-dependent dehydrogenase (short-subunit alcohol dehydrogenase family)
MSLYHRCVTIKCQGKEAKFKLRQGSSSSDITQAVKARFGIPEDKRLILTDSDGDTVILDHVLPTGMYALKIVSSESKDVTTAFGSGLKPDGVTIPDLTEASKKSLARKVVIVTGGNKGIGFASAKAFGQFGAKVILAARSEKDGQEAAKKLKAAGVDAHFCPLDISSDESVAKFKENVAKEHKGKVDILVNNAADGGDGITAPIFDTKTTQLAHTLNVNLLGTFRVIQAILPFIQANKSGHIINVSSTAGTLEWQNGQNFAYGVSKLALSGLTLGTAGYLTKSGDDIVVVQLCPGPVTTDMFNSSGAAALLSEQVLTAIGLRLRSPDEAAQDIVKLAVVSKSVGAHGKFFRYDKELFY